MHACVLISETPALNWLHACHSHIHSVTIPNGIKPSHAHYLYIQALEFIWYIKYYISKAHNISNIFHLALELTGQCASSYAAAVGIVLGNASLICCVHARCTSGRWPCPDSQTITSSCDAERSWCCQHQCERIMVLSTIMSFSCG